MELEITELSRQPLHQQVARQIRRQILGFEIEEHEELENVRELARQHRISVASVERAYQELEAQGLVERLGRERYRVAPLDDEQRRALEKQKLLEDLRRQEFSLRELELARDIQCRLLPPAEVSGSGWTVASRSEAARFVAGDFHDVIRFLDGSVAVVVADVVGKGIGASLIMASVKAMLPFIAAEETPLETVRELNDRLCGSLARREFVALALVKLDPSTGLGTLVNAGLPDPFLVRARSECREPPVSGERLPLGLRRQVAWKSLTFDLAPGDRVLLTTDGIPEATNASQEQLGYDRWAERIRSSLAEWPEAPGAWLDSLIGFVRSWTGLHSDDDLTAVVLERDA